MTSPASHRTRGHSINSWWTRKHLWTKRMRGSRGLCKMMNIRYRLCSSRDFSQGSIGAWMPRIWTSWIGMWAPWKGVCSCMKREGPRYSRICWMPLMGGPTSKSIVLTSLLSIKSLYRWLTRRVPRDRLFLNYKRMPREESISNSNR